MQGQGKMTHANGDIYEGTWHGDRKHGQGKLTSVSGAGYEGAWVAD